MAINKVAIKDPVMRKRNERERFDVELTFLDGDTPTDPVTFYWRVDNATTGAKVSGWATVSTSGATHTLTIPATASELASRLRRLETRQLLIAGTDKNVIGKLEWEIENTIGSADAIA